MGRRFALATTAAFAIASGAPLHAAEPLTLARVLDVVRAQNPAVRSAQARAAAAASIPAQARAYDDPVLAWEAWNIPDSWALDRADNNIFRVNQKIPFPGKRTLAGEMAAREADALGHESSATELDAVTGAKRAYADLWLAHRKRDLQARQLELAERISRIVEQRYATGDASQTDVLRLQVEVSHLVGDLRTAELAIDGARAGLAAYMSEPSGQVTGTPADPPPAHLPPTIDALVASALETRPEVAARAAAVAREETGLRLAKKGYFPDFELSVGRFVNADNPDGFGAMASMTIPLAWKSKYDAAVSEANARIVAAEAERRRLADDIRRDVEQAYAQARAAQVMHDLFAATHLPHAEQMLRVTEAAYVGGRGDLAALLEAAREIDRTHLEHLTATAEFEKAFADLERAVGADVPRDPTITENHHG